ncbi:hypothetical protein BKA69DRAFT_782391 [Paraphysoderma sedebokerense]|nr:hypothetical protein BKA69DRAFT_782391 [Paraphysoderma sedebokerense]
MTGSKDSSCNLWRIDLSSPSPLKSYSPESESSITLDSKISNSSITLNPASSSASFDHQYYLGRADSDVKVMQEFNELKKPVNKLLAESKLSQRGSIVKLMSSGQEYFCWYGVSSLGELSVIESRGFEVGDEKVAPAAVDISQARNGVDIERQSKQLIQKREIKRAKELIEEGSKMGQIRHSHLNSLLTPPIPPPPPAFPSTRYESFNDLAFTFDQPLKPSSLRNEFDEDWVEARKAFVADLEKFGDHGDGRLPPGFAELEVKVFEKYNPQSSLPISKLKQSILSKTKAGKFEKKGDQSLFDDIHVLRNQLEIVLENKNWKAGLTLAENVYTALRRSLDSISIDTLKQLTLLFLKHSYPEGLHFGLSITQIFASSSRNSTSPHDTAASSNSGKHVNFKNEHKFNKLKEIIHWLLFPTVYDLDDKVDAERRRLFSKSATTKSAVSSSETGEGARYQRKYDSAVDVNDKNDELLNHESRGGWMDLLQGLKSGYDLDAEEWSDVAVAKKRYDELRRRIKGALSGFLADDSLVGGMLELEMCVHFFLMLAIVILRLMRGY